jgi:hypothetical protein
VDAMTPGQCRMAWGKHFLLSNVVVIPVPNRPSHPVSSTTDTFVLVILECRID